MIRDQHCKYAQNKRYIVVYSIEAIRQIRAQHIYIYIYIYKRKVYTSL